MLRNVLFTVWAVAAVGVAEAQTLRVLSAQYGHDNRWIDVTEVLNRSINRGVLDLTVSNDFFRADPAPAQVKTLRIEYVVNGRNFREEYPENTRVVVPANGAGSVGVERGRGGDFRRDGRGELRIISARYGFDRRMADVTELMQRQVVEGAIAMHVDNNTMRGDPAVGADKVLQVEYEFRGQPGRMEVREGDDLRLPGPGMGVGGPQYGGPVRGPERVRILSAQYGAGRRFADVAGILNNYVDPNTGTVRIKVTNDTMGGDPYPGPDKTLKVDYVYQGRTLHKEVREGTDLVLP